jgi:hypothetical protein
MPTSHPVRPTSTIATFMRALGAARRTSAARASARPPPVAAPWTRQMIGCGQRRIRRMISLTRRCARMPEAGPADTSWGALRSKPAQNARPAPRRTTTRVECRVASPAK